eukprot:11166153-Lingulodinium_polyedra.AAC.1
MPRLLPQCPSLMRKTTFDAARCSLMLALGVPASGQACAEGHRADTCTFACNGARAKNLAGLTVGIEQTLRLHYFLL